MCVLTFLTWSISEKKGTKAMDKAVPDQWASPARKNSCCLFKETLQHAEQNKNIFLKKKKLFKSAVSTGPKLLTQLEWNVLPKKGK